MTPGSDCRVAFADTLIALAEADARIVAVVNDSVGSSNLKEFRRRFPDRLIAIDPQTVRREGAILQRDRFDAVIDGLRTLHV